MYLFGILKLWKVEEWSMRYYKLQFTIKEKKKKEKGSVCEGIITMEAMAWTPTYLTSQLNSVMAQVVPPKS